MGGKSSKKQELKRGHSAPVHSHRVPVQIRRVQSRCVPVDNLQSIWRVATQVQFMLLTNLKY